MKLLKTKPENLKIIIKFEVDEASNTPKNIKLSLPTKASKLEKYLLRLANIYAYDIIRNQLYDYAAKSVELEKYLKRRDRQAAKKTLLGTAHPRRVISSDC